MNTIELLSSLAPHSKQDQTIKETQWEMVPTSILTILPKSYFELINEFGHGLWGRDQVFFHPLAFSGYKLSINNLTEHYKFIVDRLELPFTNDLSTWEFVPLGILPCFEYIGWLPQENEIAFFDGDLEIMTKSGTSDLAEFLVNLIKNENIPADLVGFRHSNFAGFSPPFVSMEFDVGPPYRESTEPSRPDENGAYWG
jgi:hypothetical protein